MTDKIIMGAIAIMIVVVMFGAAMTSFTAQSTTGWSSTIFNIWQLLPLLGLLGLVLVVFTFIRGKGK